jgi:hypothetical protein
MTGMPASAPAAVEQRDAELALLSEVVILVGVGSAAAMIALQALLL